MSAHIKLIGMLESYLGGQAEISVEAGRAIRETVAALGMPPEIVALVLVNNAQQSNSAQGQRARLHRGSFGRGIEASAVHSVPLD